MSDQGKQNLQGQPKPGRQDKLPEQGLLDKETQERLRKENVQNEEKGLIHQAPGSEGGG